MKKLDLRDLERDLLVEVGRAVLEGAVLIEERAKQLVVKRTGALEHSIHIEVEGMTASVVTESGHAAVEEFGSHHQQAHPYLRPAFDAGVGQIEDHIADAITKALRG